MAKSHKGKKNPMFGKKHSDQAKERMRQARTGKVWVHEPFTLIERCIPKSHVPKYLADEWVLGRNSS